MRRYDLFFLSDTSFWLFLKAGYSLAAVCFVEFFKIEQPRRFGEIIVPLIALVEV